MYLLHRVAILVFVFSVTALSDFGRDQGNQASDCTPVSAPVASPDGTHTASDFSCAAGERAPVIQLLLSNAAGQEQRRSSLQPEKLFGESCIAQGSVRWLNNSSLNILCNYGPALNGYLVVNAESMRIEQEYTGLYFAPSPDGKVLARVGVLQRYGTPLGEKYCLVFDRQTVYPPNCSFEGEGQVTAAPFRPKARRFSNDAYADVHTFLSPVVWSPDSRRVAFVEKIFNWRYSSPYDRDFNGYADHMRYYLAVVSADAPAVGYSLSDVPDQVQVRWTGPGQVMLNGRPYDLGSTPSVPLQ